MERLDENGLRLRQVRRPANREHPAKPSAQSMPSFLRKLDLLIFSSGSSVYALTSLFNVVILPKGGKCQCLSGYLDGPEATAPCSMAFSSNDCSNSKLVSVENTLG